MWNPRQRLGDEGEQVACRFLKRRRYAIVERNYRCRVGEIDVVALERDVVVFVEVKTRTDEGFGTPLHAVDERKQRQIVRAAQYYLRQKRLLERNVRFDVVAVWRDGREWRCELVRNAFEAG
jgi:putative endonuclease